MARATHGTIVCDGECEPTMVEIDVDNFGDKAFWCTCPRCNGRATGYGHNVVDVGGCILPIRA